MSWLAFLRRQGIIENRHLSSVDGALVVSLALMPFLFMTVRMAFGLTCIVIVLLCLFLLWSEPGLKTKISKIEDLRWVLFAFVIPLLSVLFSEIIRGDVQSRNYDGPSRLLLGIPIFLVIFSRKINYWKLISTILPAVLIVTWTYASFDDLNTIRFQDRLSVHFLDPILWGDFAIMHGFICLCSVRQNDSFFKKLYLWGGLSIGVTMSLLSQSRGGWVAAIAMTAFLLWVKRKSLKSKQLILAILGAVLFLFVLYFSMDIFHTRVNQVVHDIANWTSGEEKDTSTGLRLSLWKLVAYFFIKQPVAGYGDHGMLPYLDDMRLHQLADAESVLLLQNAGPHNELLAELLRSGVFGILSYGGKYLIPLYVFGKLYFRNNRQNLAALQGMCLVIGCIVSGMSIEILSYKLVYTYYAVTMAALMGNALWLDSAIGKTKAADNIQTDTKKEDAMPAAQSNG